MITDSYQYHVVLSLVLFFSVNLLILINYVKDNSLRTYYTLFIVAIISLCFGLRAENIEGDSIHYANVFYGGSERNDEVLFQYLAFVISRVTDDVGIFFVVIAFIHNVLIFVSFRKLTHNYPLALALYYCSFIFINLNVSLIRQAIAVAMVFYATVSLIENKTIKFTAIVLVASMFHATAVLALPFLFVKKIDLTSGRLVFFLIICVFLYNISIGEIIEVMAAYSEYLARIHWYFNWGLATAWEIKHFYYLVSILVLLYSAKYAWLDEKYRTLFKFYLIGISYIVLFRQEEMVVDRVFYYFIPLTTVLLINVSSLLRIKQELSFVTIVFFLANTWLFKTMLIQYPAWWLPKF